jgi:hypothetical protein
MAEKKITVTFGAIDIGPFNNLSNSLRFRSLKVGVFANNGSGKTFLSRMFRLLDNPTIEKANIVISINKNLGNFKFQIDEKKDTGDTSEKLEIKVSKNNEPEIDNGTKYIYHVFNSDYVKENIEEMKFMPDGEVEGYILGKAKIDLTKEKLKLKTLEEEISKNGNVFRQEVEDSRVELDTLNVRKNTLEYKFTYTDVFKNSFEYQDEKSFNDLKSLNGALSRIPDDLTDIAEIEVKMKPDFLKELSMLLNSKYSKSSFAQEFKEKIDAKQSFVSAGIAKLPNDRSDWADCPFCEQELLEDAKKLIDNYVLFLNDEESKIKNSINSHISKLDDLVKDLSLDLSYQAKVVKQFDSVKQYIPSQTNVTLSEFDDSAKIEKSIILIKSLLETKKEDIEKAIGVSIYKNEIEAILNYVESSRQTINDNNTLIEELNSKRKNISGEKLELNRRLCKALYEKLRIDLKDSIDELNELIKQKNELLKDIEEKESQEKVSKKSKITDSLKYYLGCFFGDKYSLDEESFCLKFHNHVMSENATDILSDGEKSIVSFCFYLSYVHEVISKESDYQNIFFIIDDPISSLDFHYVYAVSQVLRNLKDQLNVDRSRFLIFTHNLEFMSILIRNKIIEEYVILSNGELEPLSKELVMPYEEHLRDVYSVSKDVQPSHTTPNSVRHVLETINRFEAPNLVLKEYIAKQNILDENEFIYSLMHDASHGVIRQQKAYTNEMIKKGCEVVIDFIRIKYEGQIKQIES